MSVIVLNSDELSLINSEIVISCDMLFNLLFPSIQDQLMSMQNNVCGEELNEIVRDINEHILKIKEELKKDFSNLEDFLNKQINEYTLQEQELGVELATIIKKMSILIDNNPIKNNINNNNNTPNNNVNNNNNNPISNNNNDSILSDEDFINYYQYDYKNSYGYGTTISSSGCGPTSAAMVLSYLTDEEVTPVETAQWSLDNGYRVKNNGTSWTYFESIAEEYGVTCESMNVTKENIISNLEKGKPIIMSMRPGHFTNSGHYIVLTGITEDNKITVADPNSEKRSNMTYDVDVFVKEGKRQWVYS